MTSSTARANAARRPSVMICTPAHTPWLHVRYTQSLAQTWQEFGSKGIDSAWTIEAGCSLVATARNQLAASFMASGMSHLLFIDNDICWNPSDVLRLLDHDLDMVCGLARTRSEPVNFDFMALNAPPGEPSGVLQPNGLFEIAGAPTGFLMVKRRVLACLIDAGLAPPITGSAGNYTRSPGVTPPDLRDFFAHGRDESGTYWSEDFAFSRRWRSIGGRIFADATIKLRHHGDCAYEGDPLTMFKAQPLGEEQGRAA